jgi:prephenate dehydrogenase
MKIAIIGLGLIGGSLGLALKRSGMAGVKVVGVPRREETLEQALRMGAIDEGTTDHVKGCADADIIFICTPMYLILPMVKEIASSLKKGAIISDVGSSKYEIVSGAEKSIPKKVYFVGGHPMAGKETTKLDSADPDLFKDKIWILTKTSRTSQRALEQVNKLVSSLGAKVLEMDPKTHDLVVAAISHMPLAVAVSLVNAVAGEPQKELMVKCAASGFRDTTRIASGDPILGVDMFTTNRKAVLKMISAFKKALADLERLIKEGNGEKIREELGKAQDFRGSVFGA